MFQGYSQIDRFCEQNNPGKINSEFTKYYHYTISMEILQDVGDILLFTVQGDEVDMLFSSNFGSN